MNGDTEILHQGDDIVINNEYNFADSIFDLNETNIPLLSNDFSTVANQINLQFKNVDNLLKMYKRLTKYFKTQLLIF